MTPRRERVTRTDFHHSPLTPVPVAYDFLHPFASPVDDDGTPKPRRNLPTEQALARRAAAQADSAARRAERAKTGGSKRDRRIAAKHGQRT